MTTYLRSSSPCNRTRSDRIDRPRRILLFFGSVFVTSIVLRAFSGTLPTRLSLQGDTEWEIEETRAAVSHGSAATGDALERLQRRFEHEREVRRRERRLTRKTLLTIERGLDRHDEEMRFHEARLTRLESHRFRRRWRRA